LERASEYEYHVINDDLDKAVARLCEIVGEQYDKGDGNAG